MKWNIRVEFSEMNYKFLLNLILVVAMLLLVKASLLNAVSYRFYGCVQFMDWFIMNILLLPIIYDG